jgi:hypothetical protein
MEHKSTVDHDSQSLPGVSYRIARMSIARRIDLTRRVRELGLKTKFLAASDTLSDQVELSLLNQQIDQLYMEWGLLELNGLLIDGEEATPTVLINRGPESLCHEILSAIKAECHLSEEERKN